MCEWIIFTQLIYIFNLTFKTWNFFKSTPLQASSVEFQCLFIVHILRHTFIHCPLAPQKDDEDELTDHRIKKQIIDVDTLTKQTNLLGKKCKPIRQRLCGCLVCHKKYMPHLSAVPCLFISQVYMILQLARTDQGIDDIRQDS